MLEQMLELERNLFFTLNGSDSVLLDNFMWLYSYMFTWIPFYIFFCFVFTYKKDWKEIVWTFLIVGLLVLLCDQFSSHVCKPFFHRFRPTHHPDFMNEVAVVYDYRGGLYGFISGHATNAFGFAILMALIFRNKAFSIMIFTYALVTAYSRVYLGVHFISDVVAGAISGTLIGLLVYEIYIWGRYFIMKLNKRKLRESSFTCGQAYLLIVIYVIMVSVLLIFNQQLIHLLVKPLKM